MKKERRSKGPLNNFEKNILIIVLILIPVMSIIALGVKSSKIDYYEVYVSFETQEKDRDTIKLVSREDPCLTPKEEVLIGVQARANLSWEFIDSTKTYGICREGMVIEITPHYPRLGTYY